jgi:hypothetical protein
MWALTRRKPVPLALVSVFCTLKSAPAGLPSPGGRYQNGVGEYPKTLRSHLGKVNSLQKQKRKD